LQAVAGFNGHLTGVAVAAPADSIAQSQKLVVDAQSQVHIPATLALTLWHIQGQPAAATAITQAQADQLTERVANLLAQQVILSVYLNAGGEVELRSSDLVTLPRFHTILGPSANPLLLFTDRLLGYLHNPDNSDQLASIMVNSRLVLLSIVANALHRRKLNGHNWLTEKTRAKGSETNRCVAVAGDARDAFTTFMERHGHDLNHYLEDDTLYGLTDALTGIAEVLAGVGSEVGGRDVEGVALSVVFPIGDAGVDRWPVGTLSLAGIMVGLSCVASMLNEMGSKVTLAFLPSMLQSLATIKATLSGEILQRPAVLALRVALGPIIGLAAGFCSGSPALEDMVLSSDAVKAVLVAHPQEGTLGATLSKRVRELEADPEALGLMILSVLTRVNAAVTSVKQNAVFAAVEVATLPATISLYKTAAQKQAAVAEASLAIDLEIKGLEIAQRRAEVAAMSASVAKEAAEAAAAPAAAGAAAAAVPAGHAGGAGGMP